MERRVIVDSKVMFEPKNSEGSGDGVWRRMSCDRKMRRTTTGRRWRREAGKTRRGKIEDGHGNGEEEDADCASVCGRKVKACWDFSVENCGADSFFFLTNKSGAFPASHVVRFNDAMWQNICNYKNKNLILC